MTNTADTGVEYVDIDVEVGIRVHTLMFRRRLRQEDIGQILGVTGATVSRKLRGQVAFSIVDLMKIGRALEVDPAELLPELDSNQQPSGFLFAQVREAEIVDLAAYRRSRAACSCPARPLHHPSCPARARSAS